MLILRIFVVFDQFFIHFVRVAAKVEQCLYDRKKQPRRSVFEKLSRFLTKPVNSPLHSILDLPLLR